MKITSETKLFLGIILATVILIGAAVALYSKPQAPPPQLSRDELIGERSYSRGNSSASAYLVEFSDFQCPACKAFQPVVDELVEKNKDKLLFVYRHFPLDQHTFAIPAAVAAEAAGAQGKFWEMYALLFANQEKFSDSIWKVLAGELSLDERQFNQSLDSKNLKEKILKDRDYGIAIGVNSTPTFFLNGRKLTNFSTFDEFRNMVENEIIK